MLSAAFECGFQPFDFVVEFMELAFLEGRFLAEHFKGIGFLRGCEDGYTWFDYLGFLYCYLCDGVSKYVGVFEFYWRQYTGLWQEYVGCIKPSSKSGFYYGPLAAKFLEEEKCKGRVEFERGWFVLSQGIAETKALELSAKKVSGCNQCGIVNETTAKGESFPVVAYMW